MKYREQHTMFDDPANQAAVEEVTQEQPVSEGAASNTAEGGE